MQGLVDYALVRERVPLKSFVHSLGVTLEPDGDGWRGPCPIHAEKRGASFRIDEDEVHWVCFGKCHSGGDVIDLAKLQWGCDTTTALKKLLDGAELPLREGAGRLRESYRPTPHSWQKKWVPPDLDAIDEIVRSGPGLADLWEKSPIRLEGGSHTEKIIDIILPGDPWLCIGKTNEVFWTRRRSEWRGKLEQFPLMVPSPMLTKIGRTTKGTLSEHTKEATARRIYLAIEFDFSIYGSDGITETKFVPLIRGWNDQGIKVADACAALHWHLATIPAALPFVMAVHSGGKSVHGWFRAYPLYDEATWPFMSYAHQIGADHVTWLRSQFVRIPDGRRQDGTPQRTYYLNPGEAVHE